MPSYPWEYLYADLWGPFPIGEYIFTVIDAYSRYPVAILPKNTSSKSLMKEFESIFSRHGYSLTLKSHIGPNLVSVEMENYLRSQGIRHAKSATGWPRSNEKKHVTIDHSWNEYLRFMPKVKIHNYILTKCFRIIVQQNMLQHKPQQPSFFLIETLEIIFHF